MNGNFKFLEEKKIFLFIKAIFATCAIYSSSNVVMKEDILNTLNLNYWNVINISEIAYKFDYLLSVLFTRIRLNYSACYGIEGAITVVLFVIFFYNRNLLQSIDKRGIFLSTICGILFSFFSIVGKSFACTNSFDLITFDKIQLCIALVNFIGLYFIFETLSVFIFTFSLIVSIKKVAYVETRTSDKKAVNLENNLLNRYLVMSNVVVLFLLWLPYIIIFYPGTLNVDSLFEINQVLSGHYHMHYPLFATLVFGFIMRIGKMLGNDNLGIFLYTCLQMIMSAFVLGYAIAYVTRSNEKNRIFMLMFFGLIPIWPIWFYTEVKDSLFSIWLVLYVIIIMRMVEKSGKLTSGEWILLVIDMFMVYMFRNNGVHIILMTVLAITIFYRSEKKRFVFFSSIVIISCMLINYELINALKASNQFNYDILSLPIQQTARYACEYELTDEENMIIGKLIEVEHLYKYEPEIADPVKQYGKIPINRSDLIAYLKVYVKMFFKHPKAYIEAFINLSYGYFYPNRTEYKDGIATFHINVWQNSNDYNLELYPLPSTEGLRVNIESFVYMLRNIPFIGLIFSCGIYSWLIVWLSAILIYLRKYSGLLPFLPIYGVLFVCFVSPVNAYVRYILPVMISVPFLILWVKYQMTTEE